MILQSLQYIRFGASSHMIQRLNGIDIERLADQDPQRLSLSL